MLKTVQISRIENKIVRQQLDSHAKSLKNHIVMYVEANKHEKALELVTELRMIEALFCVFVPDDMFNND